VRGGSAFRRIAAVLPALLCAVVPSLSAADARWPAAALSGSDRLLAFTLLGERPPGGVPAAAGALRRAGVLEPRGGPLERVSRGITLAPALAWDDNVNGGVPGARLGFGPFVLTVDERSRAKAGVVLGLDGGIEAGWAAGGATLLTVQAAASWRHAPEHDMGWQAGLLRGCAARMVAPWRWVEGCAAVSGIERELSSTAARRLEARHVSLHPGPWASHELSLGVWLEDRDGSVQPGLSARLTSAARIGLIDAFALAGREPEGRAGVTAAGGLGFTRVLLGAPARVAMGFAVERGGAVLGQARKDEVASVSLSRAVAAGVTARLGLARRQSTVDAFEEDLSVSLGLTFRGWRF
jgi:hypothetical protein